MPKRSSSSSRPLGGAFENRASVLPSCVAVLAAALLAFWSAASFAQASGVPAGIQAELLSKLEGYDKGFAERAGDVANVLLLVKPGSAKSAVAAAEMRSALARLDRVGGLPHRETVAAYSGAAQLAQKIRSEHVAVVYVTPGLDDELGKIREALDSVNVLTLGALAAYVPEGMVLAFEIEAGKPKILLNLEQAKHQGVKFPTEVLRLMKVFR
jgi:hypothetical protein